MKSSDQRPIQTAGQLSLQSRQSLAASAMPLEKEILREDPCVSKRV